MQQVLHCQCHLLSRGIADCGDLIYITNAEQKGLVFDTGTDAEN